jgi:hypothetical protein
MYLAIKKGAMLALKSIAGTIKNLKLLVFPFCSYVGLILLQLAANCASNQFVLNDVYYPQFRNIIAKHVNALSGLHQHLLIIAVSLGLSMIISFTLSSLSWAIYKILDGKSFSAKEGIIFGLKNSVSPTLIGLSFIPTILSIEALNHVSHTTLLGIAVETKCMFIFLFFIFAIVIHIATRYSFTKSLEEACRVIPKVIYELIGGTLVLSLMLSSVYYLIDNAHRIIAHFQMVWLYSLFNYRIGVMLMCYLPIILVLIVHMAIIFFLVRICHDLALNKIIVSNRLSQFVSKIMRLFSRK